MLAYASIAYLTIGSAISCWGLVYPIDGVFNDECVGFILLDICCSVKLECPQAIAVPAINQGCSLP